MKGEAEKCLDLLNRQIVGLLLAWQLPVSIRVKCIQSKKEMRILHQRKDIPEKTEKGQIVKGLSLSLICSTLSQVGYIEPCDWADWVKTSARTPFLTIRGAISLQPAPTKQVQFLSLGVHPIEPQTCGNVLYDEVNWLFALSTFGNQEELSSDDGVTKLKRSEDLRFKQDGFTNKQLKGGGKGVDRWPMFYLRIEMESANSFSEDSLEKLGESGLAGLLKVLGAMVTEFLHQNLFRPRAKHATRKQGSPRISQTSRSGLKSPDLDPNSRILRSSSIKDQGNVFGSWSRIKSGVHVKSLAACPSLVSPITQPCKGQSSISIPSNSYNRLTAAPQATFASTSKERTVEWINPISGAAVTVDARTGLVIEPQSSKRPASAPTRSKRWSLPVTGGLKQKVASDIEKRVTRSASSPPDDVSKTTSCSSDLLKQWENPVFQTAEKPIPYISFDGTSSGIPSNLNGEHHRCTDADIQNAFSHSSLLSSAKLSRSMLKDAEIIAQVDQKYILIRMPTKPDPRTLRVPSEKILVLVDQHAADERIRVETLLAELMKSPVRLARPIVFEIMAREKDLLTRHIPYFASWGVIYDIRIMPHSANYSLFIKRLPTPIAERCRVEPKILIELLRGEAWKREERSSKPQAPNEESDSPSKHQAKGNNGWLARLSTCPQRLLDMLNSRACRSAIMFNDRLTIAECQTLMQRLGECAFPFQCAHGRPSMVPLVSVRNGAEEGPEKGGFDADVGDEEKGFREAWKGWKSTGDGETVGRKRVKLA